MRKHLSSLHKNQGFSLIEQLYAILILMIAVLLIIPILAGSLHKVRNEDFKIKAVNLTQEMIESVRSSPYSELQNGTYLTSGTGPSPSTSSLAVAFQDFKSKVTQASYLPSGTGTLIIQPATALTTSVDIKEVKVSVFWKERQANKSFELPTYIYRVVRE